MPYTVASGDAGSATLDLSPGTALVYYLIPPRRARLRLDVRGRGSLRVRVSTDADHREGRLPTALLEEPLRPTGGQHELDLAGYGGVPLRLELAIGGAGEEAGASLRALQLVARAFRVQGQRDRQTRLTILLGVQRRCEVAIERDRQAAARAVEQTDAQVTCLFGQAPG